MKKLLLFLSLALLCTSCIKKIEEFRRDWYIYNQTGRVLQLKCPYSESFLESDLEYKTLELQPNASIKICSGQVPAKDKPYIYYYFKKSSEKFGDDVSWQILSEDDIVLKEWSYLDRNLPDQRFFEESAWYNDIRPGGEIWHYFAFIIQPDDIAE